MHKLMGRAIKMLRVKYDMSQSELAKNVGISLSLLSYVERGLRETRLDTYQKIASELNLELSGLVAIAEELPPSHREERATNGQR